MLTQYILIFLSPIIPQYIAAVITLHVRVNRLYIVNS